MSGKADLGTTRQAAPPELSVVIPVYNRPIAVGRAIDSALMQGIPQIEILVVDDSSEPPLHLSPAQSVDPRVHILCHSHNRGAAAARNTGLRAARGTWIAFLDSDDRWLPNTLAPRLAQAREAAAASGEPLIVYVAGFEYIRPPRIHPEIRIPLPASDPLDFASGCWFSPGSTALFLRENVVIRIGLQNESLRRFEDVEWFLRLALAGGRIAVAPIVAARIETAARPSAAAVAREGRLLFDAIAWPEDRTLRRRLARRLEAWLAIECASAQWYEGDRARALLHLARSWWLAPRPTLYLRNFWRREAVP